MLTDPIDLSFGMMSEVRAALGLDWALGARSYAIRDSRIEDPSAENSLSVFGIELRGQVGRDRGMPSAQAKRPNVFTSGRCKPKSVAQGTRRVIAKLVTYDLS